MNTEELAYLGIEKLRMRFEKKINPEEYYYHSAEVWTVSCFTGLSKTF
jgi:hypothetical protein